MECFCVRQSDVPGTSKLFSDLIYQFDRVADLYPYPPCDVESLVAAARFDFPDERRAALVKAIAPLNAGNPSLARLAKPGTVAIVTGQQVGLFSGPAYSIFKALGAVKAAQALTERGIEAVPVFWAATEDHDFAEINHTWVFGPDHQPKKVQLSAVASGQRPAGTVVSASFPLDELRAAMAGLPFADEVCDLVAKCYSDGSSMGTAFLRLIGELLKPYGLLFVDPLAPGLIEIRAPLMAEAMRQMGHLTEALRLRTKELEARGYHAQVLVDQQTSLAFLLANGERVSLKCSNGEFVAQHSGSSLRRFSAAELIDRAQDLSPNALLRPVIQDYMLPTAAYIGGPAELAYLAQSQVLYGPLLGRQPAALPRPFFTIVDERTQKKVGRYGLKPTDLFVREDILRDRIASHLVPTELRATLDRTQATVNRSLDLLSFELERFDVSLSLALGTSRRKIEHQMGKIGRKTAAQMMKRDEQATRDARMLSGFVFPEKHLQERLYSILPFLAQFGPGLIGEIESAIRVDCPDHQFMIV